MLPTSAIKNQRLMSDPIAVEKIDDQYSPTMRPALAQTSNTNKTAKVNIFIL